MLPSTRCARWYPRVGARRISVSIRQRAGVIRLSREPAAVVEHVIRSHVVLNVAVETSQLVHRLAANFTVAWFRGAVHDVVRLGLDRPGTVSGRVTRHVRQRQRVVDEFAVELLQSGEAGVTGQLRTPRSVHAEDAESGHEQSDDERDKHDDNNGCTD